MSQRTLKKRAYDDKIWEREIQEVGTQTESPKNDQAFKKEVDKIVDHTTEGSRMGVRFAVVWKGYKFDLLERSDLIIEKGGKEKLREYLTKLSQTKIEKRRFTALINNQPDLAELLRTDGSQPIQK